MKTIFDYSLSIFALIVLSPLLLVLMITALFIHGQPIFFRQQRPGLHGKPFGIIKFRTMLNTYDDKGNLLPDEERTTKFGEFLRSTSLDELPELINVIKGEMSIVGPRPLIMAYLPLYNKEQARRHDVKPGITGLAQVGGRNALSWDQRFDLDIEYVDTHNLLLDISIILKTIKTVFKREGIGHADLAALSEFKGDALAQTDKQNI